MAADGVLASPAVGNSAAEKVQPTEEQVVEAARAHLAVSPELGIGKLLVQLQSENSWMLSEKRLRSILASTELLQRRRGGGGRATGTTAADADDQGEKDAALMSSASNGGKGGKKKKKGRGAGAGAAFSSSSSSSSAPSYIPRSHLDTLLPLPTGVQAKYFDDVKGKGLIAAQDYKEGDVLFTEDAFVAAPPSHALKSVDDGELCTSCFAPLNSSLVVRCGQKDCIARFCNRLCEGRANSTHHQLLCPGQNPSIKVRPVGEIPFCTMRLCPDHFFFSFSFLFSQPFRKYLAIQRWLSLSLVSRMVARILLTHASNGQGPPSASASVQQAVKSRGAAQRGGGRGVDEAARATLEETLAHLDAFATVSELERRARNPGWGVEREAYLKGMQEGHRLLCEGMDPRAARKTKFPLRTGEFPDKVAADLFSWESFLRMLGRANLNSEAQGGMYLVHSHLNHSCAPNVAVRHPPSPRSGVRQATKVAAVATRSIVAGEELFITYQHPDTPVLRRRMLLWREYMFGPCACERCVAEEACLDDDERSAMQSGTWTHDAQAEEEIAKRKAHAETMEQLDKERRAKLRSEGKHVPEPHEMAGLEDELRTSLGF